MTSAPRVSVIIPCYNHAAYLPESLGSVLSQTVPLHEVIVIDDGSSDGSAEIAGAFAPSVTVVSQPNSGIAAARNAGLQLARGDYIAFLDADDVWPADSLAARLAAFALDPATEVVFGLVEQFLSPELDAEARMRLHCPPGLSPARLAGCMLAQKRTIDRIGLFDTSLKVGETMDWVARLNSDGAHSTIINQLVLRRRIHGSNTVLTHSVPSDYLQVLRASLKRRAAMEQS